MFAPRLIMYHKQSTSARTRFLKLAYGGVCGFAALPPEAMIDEAPGASAKVVTHPAAVLRDAEVHLGLHRGPDNRARRICVDPHGLSISARFGSV
jgi:hypothetical protein